MRYKSTELVPAMPEASRNPEIGDILRRRDAAFCWLITVCAVLALLISLRLVRLWAL